VVNVGDVWDISRSADGNELTVLVVSVENDGSCTALVLHGFGVYHDWNGKVFSGFGCGYHPWKLIGGPVVRLSG
jgi:hypothetical protein